MTMHRMNAQVSLGFFRIQMNSGVSGDSIFKKSNKAAHTTASKQPVHEFKLTSSPRMA